MTETANYPAPMPSAARLAVWSPCSAMPTVFRERFQRGLGALQRAGYSPVVLDSCETKRPVGAWSPASAAAELHDILRSDVDGVIAAIGGWASNRVLQHLDYDLIRLANKPIIGYSDFTAILNAVTTRSRLVTFHGPMVMSEWAEAGGPWPYTVAAFQRATSAAPGDSWDIAASPQWTDEYLAWDHDDRRPRTPRSTGTAMRSLRAGRGCGEIWGGNITVLTSLMGSEYWAPPAHAIVILEGEELGVEEAMHYLEALRLAGLFDAVVGLLVGKISRPRPNGVDMGCFDTALLAILAEFDFPIVVNADIGHTEPMATIPIGGRAELDAAPSGPLIKVMVE